MSTRASAARIACTAHRDRIARTAPSAALAALAALALLAALASAALAPSPAWANSARTHWEGVSATGAIVAGSNLAASEGDAEADGDGNAHAACPLEVAHETLTFSIPSFPQEHADDGDETAPYDARVTAAYTFYNPADYRVSATLLFPFGKLPGYQPSPAPAAQDALGGGAYGITVNGEPAECTVRHTLSYPYEAFDLQTDLARLENDYTADDFYALELAATKYVFEVEGIPTGNDAATAGLYWKPAEGSKVLLMNQSGLQSATEDAESVILTTWAKNGERITLYVFGAAPEEGVSSGIFADGSCEEPLDGQLTLVEREESSFARFALAEWTEESGVLPHDWYNAMVADLNRCEASWGEDAGIIMRNESGAHDGLDLTNLLLQWYEYTIALEPGATLENTVTAPLYPSIDAGYEPAVYCYTYLLSPAQTWAAFGGLDIAVNTPFHLIESSFAQDDAEKEQAEGGLLGSALATRAATKNLVGFARTDSGYAASFDSLPDGELTFSLSAGATPRAAWTYGGNDALAKFVFVAVLLAGGIALGVLAGKRAKKPQA